MQSLFIEENDVIEIKFAVATNDKGAIFCDLGKDKLISGLKEVNIDPEEYEIKEYMANFKKPNFGDTPILYETVFTSNGQNVSFNPIAARLRKIMILIKDWNLTGEFKKPTEEEIKKLNPIVASVIGAELDVEIGSIG